MSKKNAKEPDAPPVDSLTYEEAMAEIESITDRLENGAIGLADSVEAYARGKSLVARCRSLIDSAEQRVRELSEAEDEADDQADDEQEG